MRPKQTQAPAKLTDTPFRVICVTIKQSYNRGFDSCQGYSYGKADMGYPGLIRSPWPGVPLAWWKRSY